CAAILTAWALSFAGPSNGLTNWPGTGAAASATPPLLLLVSRCAYTLSGNTQVDTRIEARAGCHGRKNRALISCEKAITRNLSFDFWASNDRASCGLGGNRVLGNGN